MERKLAILAESKCASIFRLVRNPFVACIVPLVSMRDRYPWTWVEAQTVRAIETWSDCALQPMPAASQYTPCEQRKRERAYDEGMRSVEREARKAPRTPAERRELQRRIVETFPRFATIALDLQPEAAQLITGSFLPVGTQLARWTRAFDESMSIADTIQACRNAWTAAGLQTLLGLPMELTSSILGYSLLYPCSDNYLDDAELPSGQKLRFSERFRQRLCGTELEAEDPHEQAVWTMVRLIEDQYSRQCFPQVYDSLLAIHRAQEMSMAQLASETNRCDEATVLGISCAKGGTSVLANACLAQPLLNDEESQFSFEWGVLLQLGDDLQDVRDDLRRGSATLFTRAAAAGIPLDDLVAQLLIFSQRVADRMNKLPNGTTALKSLLRMSWRSLILMAVANAKPLFSGEFLHELEATSPFRFDFLRARNERLDGRESLYGVLFEAFIEAGECGEYSVPLPGKVACETATASTGGLQALWRSFA